MQFASLLRPQTLGEFVGQKHLLGETAVFRKLISSSRLPHSFFFGPPGSGKTTLARIIAKELSVDFFELNATTLKIDEIRKIVDTFKNALTKPLIFIDESHRLSKTQQEVLLPVMENSFATIIGASTENPFFALTGGIRSRSLLFEFKAHTDEDLRELLGRAVERFGITATDGAAEYAIYSSCGDARAMLTLLEYASIASQVVTVELLKELRPKSLGDGASDDESHYNLSSALIKSVRGSDVDAAIHYLARLIAGGEEPRFIARRLAILASEDIGNANPNALVLANSALGIVSFIGYPEARIVLSQLVIYLACCPKSNTAITAIDSFLADINGGFAPAVPNHLKDAHYAGAKKLGRGNDYRYPHDFGGYVAQKYLSAKTPHSVELKDMAFEKTLAEWLTKIKA
jgi:putative ATPase